MGEHESRSRDGSYHSSPPPRDSLFAENVGEAPFNFGRIRIGKIRLLADKDLLCTTLAFAVKKEEDDHDERGSSQNDGDTTIDKGGRV